MPYKKKPKARKKKIILIVAIVITSLILAASSVFAYTVHKENEEAKAAAALDALPRIVVPEGHFKKASYSCELTKNVKAVTIRPKIDIYKDINADKATIEAEVDKIIEDVKSLSFKSIVLDTRLDDSVVFSSKELACTPIDLLSIMQTKAQENEINLAVIFNLTGVKSSKGEVINSFLPFKNRQTMADAMSELASNYEIESILLDGYYPKNNGEAFAEYKSYGSVGDYETWLKENVNSVIDEVINQTKITKSSLPIGICVSSVWANADTIEGGCKTKAEFESLVDGYADTKALVESGAVDFINVKVSTFTKDPNENFENIVNWWGGICKKSQIPMYITHCGENAVNSKLPGWSGIDELTHQIMCADESGNYYGSTFTGISTLIKNPQDSTDYLKRYYAGQISKEDSLQGLNITSPKKHNIVTYEESYQFRMSFDPNAEVFLNGEKVEPSSRGGASVWVPLKIGDNEITLKHKGKSDTYHIKRDIIIFKEVSPTGAIKVPGSSTIQLSALAYTGSKITANINGTTVTLTEGGGGDENNAESVYRVFQGSYKVPKGAKKDKPIGAIKFYGNYKNICKEPATGASVTILKLEDEVDPDAATGKILQHAIVTRNYANTYPFKTTGGYPQAIPYQLPKGTQDIVVSHSGNFLNLRSGKTILASDATLQDIPFEGNNPISKMTVGVENNDTVIRAQMQWQSPFSINLSPYAGYSTPMGKMDYNFNANTVTILLDYGTTLKPENVIGDMSASPVFSDITHKRIKNEARGTWQYQITLPLRQVGRYYGCHAEWEDNTLVMRFNHPASSGSLSGVRVAIDAGHGGKDNGTMAGRDCVEKDVNFEYAYKLQASLESLGAQVVMIRQGDEYIDNNYRVDIAEANYCDLYIALHQNSAGSNGNAYGVQTYYNAPFSQPLAKYVQESLETVASPSRWNKWNGSKPEYNFIVTRERQFPSILIECGYLSNIEDEAKALDPSYQQQMCDAIARGVVNYYL